MPLNLRWGRVELPIGLGLVFLVLLLSAIINLLTKETATKWGLGLSRRYCKLVAIRSPHSLSMLEKTLLAPLQRMRAAADVEE